MEEGGEAKNRINTERRTETLMGLGWGGMNAKKIVQGKQPGTALLRSDRQTWI